MNADNYGYQPPAPLSPILLMFAAILAGVFLFKTIASMIQ